LLVYSVSESALLLRELTESLQPLTAIFPFFGDLGRDFFDIDCEVAATVDTKSLNAAPPMSASVKADEFTPKTAVRCDPNPT
jgi:hypothetical protein